MVSRNQISHIALLAHTSTERGRQAELDLLVVEIKMRMGIRAAARRSHHENFSGGRSPSARLIGVAVEAPLYLWFGTSQVENKHDMEEGRTTS